MTEMETLRQAIYSRLSHVQPPHTIKGTLGASAVYYSKGNWKGELLSNLIDELVAFAGDLIRRMVFNQEECLEQLRTLQAKKDSCRGEPYYQIRS